MHSLFSKEDCPETRKYLPEPALAVAIFAVLSVATISASGVPLLLSLLLGGFLLVLSAIDVRSGRLPNFLTVPLLALGIATIWIVNPAALVDHILGSAIGFAGFFLISLTHHRLRGYEGLGGGDAKLLAAIGAWVGWQALPTVVLCAATTALLYSVVARSTSGQTRIAFGPHLALAGWLVWIFGPLIPS